MEVNGLFHAPLKCVTDTSFFKVLNKNLMCAHYGGGGGGVMASAARHSKIIAETAHTEQAKKHECL